MHDMAYWSAVTHAKTVDVVNILTEFISRQTLVYHVYWTACRHTNFFCISSIVWINDKNCSLTIVLTAMDQKLQKS